MAECQGVLMFCIKVFLLCFGLEIRLPVCQPQHLSEISVLSSAVRCNSASVDDRAICLVPVGKHLSRHETQERLDQAF